MNGLDATAHAIGKLESALEAQKDAFVEHARREESDRGLIMSKLDKIEGYMGRVDVIEQRVDKMEPDVAAGKLMWAKLAAIATFAGGVFSLLIEGVRAFGHDILAIFQRH